MGYIIKKAMTLNGTPREAGDIVRTDEFIPRRALMLMRSGHIERTDVEPKTLEEMAAEQEAARKAQEEAARKAAEEAARKAAGRRKAGDA